MAYNNYQYPMYSPGYMQMAPQVPLQAPQAAQMSGQGLSTASRMVSNRDEANAIPADFSGSLMVFPDVKNNRVYIKRWNFQTGAADFLEFAPVLPEAKDSPKYATVEELNALREEFRKAVSHNADE